MRTERIADSGLPLYVCTAERPTLLSTFRELWSFRRLLYIFAWRDLRVRYKHTVIGALWNVIQPLGLMLVFTLVFGVLFTGRTGDVPYPLFLYPALILWQFFSRAIVQGGTSLEAFRTVLENIYFPRMIAPMAAILSVLVDLAVAFIPLAVLMASYGVAPTPRVLLAPVFVLATLMLGLGLAIWLSALDALYRDIRHTIAFVLQFWMFATPIMYPLELIPEAYRSAYILNPMVGLVEGFRWSLIGGSPLSLEILAPPAVLSLLLLVGGARYFNRLEGTLVDTI